MPRTYATHSKTISDANLRDLVASFLYQTQSVNDFDEVLELKLGEPDTKGFRTITYKTIKIKEPELLIHT